MPKPGIRREGMGGFLNPPTHPEHFMSVGYETGIMRLSTAVESEWLDPAVRAEAKRQLEEWRRPPLESPEIQDWIHNVLGYYRNCYQGEGAEPQCWWASQLIHTHIDPVLNQDKHAGVHFIRKYYPEFVATIEHFENAYWGEKK